MIEWLPTPSAELLKVATPLLLSVPLPSNVAPSLKLTAPVAVPAVQATVAVKVTAWPEEDGLGAQVKAVVVAVVGIGLPDGGLTPVGETKVQPAMSL